MEGIPYLFPVSSSQWSTQNPFEQTSSPTQQNTPPDGTILFSPGNFYYPSPPSVFQQIPYMSPPPNSYFVPTQYSQPFFASPIPTQSFIQESDNNNKGFLIPILNDPKEINGAYHGLKKNIILGFPPQGKESLQEFKIVVDCKIRQCSTTNCGKCGSQNPTYPKKGELILTTDSPYVKVDHPNCQSEILVSNKKRPRKEEWISIPIIVIYPDQEIIDGIYFRIFNETINLWSEPLVMKKPSTSKKKNISKYDTGRSFVEQTPILTISNIATYMAKKGEVGEVNFFRNCLVDFFKQKGTEEQLSCFDLDLFRLFYGEWSSEEASRNLRDMYNRPGFIGHKQTEINFMDQESYVIRYSSKQFHGGYFVVENCTDSWRMKRIGNENLFENENGDEQITIDQLLHMWKLTKPLGSKNNYRTKFFRKSLDE